MRLTQRLDLRLLAPTVLVSLILVGFCVVGALYLNNLHVNAAAVLRENVQSTQAAAELHTATQELMRLLRSEHRAAADFGAQVENENRAASHLLHEAEDLANYPSEKVLVGRIASGWNAYLERWSRRGALAVSEEHAYDASLAELLAQKVLRPCGELRDFNTGQIEISDQENQTILRTFTWGMLAVAVGGPLAGLLLGFAVARSLRRSIYQLSVHIRDAAGRLSREVGSVTLKEDSDLPELQHQMRNIIDEIGRVVDQLEQREREVLRAEQLAAVGQVAAGVAHELRNPLAAIKMFVQAGLDDRSPAGLPPEDLVIVEREIRRIERRLQSFLDFARPPRSERRQADLLEVANRALALLEGRARQQHVTLAREFRADSVDLLIDPEQIHQVLVNLLLNALDALPQGGKITLTVSVEDRADDRHVAVSVRDTGAGLLPHIRARLFEPFVSSKETGVGLGLSLCKRLIEAHGGTIQGSNTREGGAQFVFTLPLEEAHALVTHR